MRLQAQWFDHTTEMISIATYHTSSSSIGKRRLVRLHLWKGAKRGKRRQHGGQTSDAEMGDGNAAIDEFIAHAPDIPFYKDILYTREQQCSPDRDNRGKRRHQGKQSKNKRGKSLYELLHGPEAEQTAFDWCVEVGLLSDGRDPSIRLLVRNVKRQRHGTLWSA